MANPNKAKAKAKKPAPKPAKAVVRKKPAKAKATQPAQSAQKSQKQSQKPKSPVKATKPAAAKAESTDTKAEPKGNAKAAAKPISTPISKNNSSKSNGASGRSRTDFQAPPKAKPALKLNPFLKKQQERLLQLRDGMLDSMAGVAKDNLRARAEGSEASAFGMHQADAGSDAYDRDFALSLLSQEQDALYEIDEALKRVELGTYGVCEMSGKPIPHARLEAIPFARFTVECQSQLEKQNKLSRTRTPVTSLFGLTDDEGGDSEEEESPAESKE